MADHQEQQQHESSAFATMSQQQPELSIGLTLAARKDSGSEMLKQEECKFDDVMALQKKAIQFKKGHTVTVLKCFLEEEYEFKQHNTQLFLENRLMLDPFSLTDFKSVISARSIEIEVRQEEPSDGSSSPASRK